VSESQAEDDQSPGAEGPTAEELANRFVAELQKAKVSDLLAETCSVIASLGYAKLAPETRDLDDARVAIEALKALTPLLPEPAERDIRQVTANLQLAFADAAAGGDAAPDEPSGS
jgi:hypothetical protein